jgi:hypothetical protein
LHPIANLNLTEVIAPTIESALISAIDIGRIAILIVTIIACTAQQQPAYEGSDPIAASTTVMTTMSPMPTIS